MLSGIFLAVLIASTSPGVTRAPEQIPDPNRDELAGSYGFTAQTALGTCGTVRLAWLSPSNQLQLCDGARWRQVWTDEDGTVASPDQDLLVHAIILQAQDNENALQINGRGRVDFGPGTNDFVQSVGGLIQFGGSVAFSNGQSLSVSILTSPAAKVQIALTSWAQFIPIAVPACTSGDKGGLAAFTTDGRAYWCDGAAAQRLVAGPTATVVTIDPPAVLLGLCITQTATVAGALTTDSVVVNPQAALVSGLSIAYAYVSATGTVSFDLCSNSTTINLDQPSTQFRFTLLR